LNESIYVLGGFQSAVSNSIEKFSVSLNVWTLLPTSLPEKIWQHGCFALDSKKILVFGGEKDSEEPNKISFIYDTSKEGFSSTTSIENIPVYLYFWIQVIRDEDFLLTINKEKTLVKYSILENKWSLADLG
jgi:N-acetylneuraminic acid mutarotase